MTIRAELSARSSGDDRGVVLPLIALLLVALLVITAIVIDLGNGRQEKRHIQNAIDAAALAGAMKYNPAVAATELVAMNEAMLYLRRNQVNAPTAVNGVYGYKCTGAQSCDISLKPASGARCLAVAVTNFRVGTFFAGVIGQDEILVRASGTGCAVPGPPGPPTVTLGPDIPAVHTAGVCSDKEGFVTSGAQNRFQGDLYANDNPKDAGADNRVTTGFLARYRGALLANNGLWTTQILGEASSDSWPEGFDPDPTKTPNLNISRYKPGGDRAKAYGEGHTGAGGTSFYTSTNQTLWSGPTPAGVYYVGAASLEIKPGFSVTPRTGWLRIDPLTGLPSASGTPELKAGTGVTFVTDSTLFKVSGDGIEIQAFNWELNRLVLYAGWTDVLGKDRCTKPSVELSGNCIHLNGVVYAPRGAINVASGEGSGNDHNGSGCGHTHPTFRGGFVGYGMKVNGNKGYYRGGPGSLAYIPGAPGPVDHYLRE
jgi:hypothetical protein